MSDSVKLPGGGGIVWDSGFGSRLNGAYDKAQQTLDNEIVSGCEPYVAFRTGALARSCPLNTVIGSGEIRWRTPYASDIYYREYTGSNGDPNRGGFWFERWKAAHGDAVIQKVKGAFDL
jgi:hypothetical protein